jgi:hypothetical protein
MSGRRKLCLGNVNLAERDLSSEISRIGDYVVDLMPNLADAKYRYYLVFPLALAVLEVYFFLA